MLIFPGFQLCSNCLCLFVNPFRISYRGYPVKNIYLKKTRICGFSSIKWVVMVIKGHQGISMHIVQQVCSTYLCRAMARISLAIPSRQQIYLHNIQPLSALPWQLTPIVICTEHESRSVGRSHHIFSRWSTHTRTKKLFHPKTNNFANAHPTKVNMGRCARVCCLFIIFPKSKSYVRRIAPVL